MIRYPANTIGPFTLWGCPDTREGMCARLTDTSVSTKDPRLHYIIRGLQLVAEFYHGREPCLAIRGVTGPVRMRRRDQ